MIYDDDVGTTNTKNGDDGDRHRADSDDSDADCSRRSHHRNCNLPRPMRASNFSTTNDDDGETDATSFDDVGPSTNSLGCTLPSFDNFLSLSTRPCRCANPPVRRRSGLSSCHW